MTTAKPRPPLAPGETRAYPVLPLRNIVVFPHMIVQLFVGRKKSIRALEEVMRSGTFVLLATQKNASDDDPSTEAESCAKCGRSGSCGADRVIEKYGAGAKLFAWSRDKRRPCTYDLGSRRLAGRNTVPSCGRFMHRRLCRGGPS